MRTLIQSNFEVMCELIRNQKQYCVYCGEDITHKRNKVFCDMACRKAHLGEKTEKNN